MIKAATIQVYQFNGLRWATEYNAVHAGLTHGIDAQTVNGINTLLTAFAALEALILESAACMHPQLYADRRFRRQALVEKFRQFLEVDGRNGEALPPVIQEVSDHRIALTHSEPDNERSRQVGTVISATDTRRFADAITETANWLWNGRGPYPVAHEFDRPNIFLGELAAPDGHA